MPHHACAAPCPPHAAWHPCPKQIYASAPGSRPPPSPPTWHDTSLSGTIVVARCCCTWLSH
eukprot:5579258-Lingulodinium_polyedra.AAC.1